MVRFSIFYFVVVIENTKSNGWAVLIHFCIIFNQIIHFVKIENFPDNSIKMFLLIKKEAMIDYWDYDSNGEIPSCQSLLLFVNIFNDDLKIASRIKTRVTAHGSFLPTSPFYLLYWTLIWMISWWLLWLIMIHLIVNMMSIDWHYY